LKSGSVGYRVQSAAKVGERIQTKDIAACAARRSNPDRDRVDARGPVTRCNKDVRPWWTSWRSSTGENFGIRTAAQNRQSSENAPDKGGFGPKRVIFGHQAKENSPFLRVGKQLVAAREALRRPGSQPANGCRVAPHPLG